MTLVFYDAEADEILSWTFVDVRTDAFFPMHFERDRHLYPMRFYDFDKFLVRQHVHLIGLL